MTILDHFMLTTFKKSLSLHVNCRMQQLFGAVVLPTSFGYSIQERIIKYYIKFAQFGASISYIIYSK